MTQEISDNLLPENWFTDNEGQLSVDVIETPDKIIIRSAIAGVSVNDLDISVTNDTVTVRGAREKCTYSDQEIAHIEECYWGNFSRSVILPGYIKPEETDAVLKNGILTITLKKLEPGSRVQVLNLDDN